MNMGEFLDSSFDSVNSDVSFSDEIYTTPKQELADKIVGLKLKENRFRLVNRIGSKHVKVTWMTLYETLVQDIMLNINSLKELKMRIQSTLKLTNLAKLEKKKDELTLYDYKFKYDNKQDKGFVNNILTKYNDPQFLEKNKLLNLQKRKSVGIEYSRSTPASKKSSFPMTKISYLLKKGTIATQYTLSPNVSTNEGTLHTRNVERRKTIQDIITPGICFLI
jgi:hypothetical protein